MRKIFYIDVGDMPQAKAEAHVKAIMSQYKDNSGDFWFARKSGGTSVEFMPDEDQEIRRESLNYAMQIVGPASTSALFAEAKKIEAYIREGKTE
jgi:hypothetical protein